MRMYKIIRNGFIELVGFGSGGIEINEDEYHTILQTVNDKPTDPEGYVYMLSENLEWVLTEKEPDIYPDPAKEAESADYQSALSDMGVSV